MNETEVIQFWLINSDQDTREKFNLTSTELENIIDQWRQ